MGLDNKPMARNSQMQSNSQSGKQAEDGNNRQKNYSVYCREIDWVGDTELVSMITVVWLMITVWFQ